MSNIEADTKKGEIEHFAFTIDPEHPLHKGRPVWMWIGGIPGVDVSISFSKADGELRDEVFEASEEFMDTLLEIVCRQRYLKLKKRLETNLEHIPKGELETEYARAYEDILHEMYELSEYVDLRKLPKEETPPEAQDAVSQTEQAYTLGKEEFERLMQEWIQKHHRTSFVTDAALDKGQAEGSSQDGEFVSTLRDIKTILERMEGTLSATTLEPGMVVNLTSTCAPGITREDIRTYCRLIQEEFDKMMQDYEKRKSRKTYVGGRGGGVPEMVISIPCPPKGGRDDSSQSHM